MDVRKYIWSAAAVCAAIPLACQSADGVLEINQACAEQRGAVAGDDPGCFDGDADGFPVTITASGSYKLTSNLQPPDIDTTAIDSQADQVTLNLSGFGIIFPGTGCISGALCPQGAGDGIAGARSNAVSNGFVKNAGRRGIWLDDLAMVENVRVENSGEDGIRLGNASLLTRAIVNSSGANGGSLAFPTSFSHSIFRSNARLDSQAFADRDGGIAAIGNFCSDNSCGPAPRARRYYLTQDEFTGGEAATACAAGFHTASIFEISDTSALRYDATLGLTTPFGGEGPPPNGGAGWALGVPGQTCDGFTSEAGTGYTYLPTLVVAEGLNATIGFAQAGWNFGGTSTCASSNRVWCIED